MKTQDEKVVRLKRALEAYFRLCGAEDNYEGPHNIGEYANELRRCLEAGHITSKLVHSVLSHNKNCPLPDTRSMVDRFFVWWDI